MVMKSVMDAEPTAEEIKEFEANDTETRLLEEQNEREIARAKGELTQSQLDPLDDCDPRNQRVEDSERDARLRHKDYDYVVDNFTVPLLRRMPRAFTVLRDTADAGEAAYALGKLIRDPTLANDPKYRDFEPYLKYISELNTGKFDNLSVTNFERVLDAYKEQAEEGETIEEFFDKMMR